MFETIAVILAAGKGKRMNSSLPKVLHPVAGRPMVAYSINIAIETTGQKPILVVGHKAELLQKTLGDTVEYAFQLEQLGTGDAVRQAESLVNGKYQNVLVISADMPLLSTATLMQLVAAHHSDKGPMTMLTIIGDNPRGFGRVIRNSDHQVIAIVEEAIATNEQLDIRELNAGVYCFSSHWLWKALRKIKISQKGEYFLTDLVEISVNEGFPVNAITLADPLEAIGVNTQEHLLEVEKILKDRIFQAN